jgi:hypothetical protein
MNSRIPSDGVRLTLKVLLPLCPGGGTGAIPYEPSTGLVLRMLQEGRLR